MIYLPSMIPVEGLDRARRAEDVMNGLIRPWRETYGWAGRATATAEIGTNPRMSLVIVELCGPRTALCHLPSLRKKLRRIAENYAGRCSKTNAGIKRHGEDVVLSDGTTVEDGEAYVASSYTFSY